MTPLQVERLNITWGLKLQANAFQTLPHVGWSELRVSLLLLAYQFISESNIWSTRICFQVNHILHVFGSEIFTAIHRSIYWIPHERDPETVKFQN